MDHTLKIGRMVHWFPTQPLVETGARDPNNECRPATVIRVHPDRTTGDMQRVDVEVHAGGKAPMASWNIEHAPSTALSAERTFNPTWHWPDECPDGL